MTEAAPGGGGGGSVTIPGDPGELSRLSGVYANAAGTMASAAGQLRSSLGDATDWKGAGASADAVRVQALAAAHQVGSDAMSAASQALSTYATELTRAQALAKQANQTTAAASTTAVSLANAMSTAATASTKAPNSGVAFRLAGPGISPAQAAQAQVASLQTTFNDQQTSATNLGTQAFDLATAAATKAAAAFAKVVQMAGSSSLHGSSNPWASYLGVSSPGLAATLIEAGYNLGGMPPDGDNQALTDLAADPGEDATHRALAAKYAASNALYAKVVNKDFAYLRSKGVNGSMPLGWQDLSPEAQAGVLATEIAYLKAHPSASGWQLLGLHVASVLLGGTAAVLTFVSLAQLGADPVTDGGDVAAVAGEDAVDDTVSQEVAQASRAKLLNGLASLAGLGATGSDVASDGISGNWNVPGLVLDSAAVVPGIGAYVADGKVLESTIATEDTAAELAQAQRGTAEYAALQRTLTELKNGTMTTDTIAKLLAAKSLSAGLGGWTYSSATLATNPFG